MADITDIKAILYTEKTIELQEHGVIVVQTSPRMTKNGLKEVFKEYFGVTPSKLNSLRLCKLFKIVITKTFIKHYLLLI